MAITSKPNGLVNGSASKEDAKEEFFRLYSEALEESIRNDYEYWIEVQRKALIN